MKERVGSYLELTKPKVTLLNLLVGVTCFFLAAFPSINLTNVAFFCVSGYLVCGGCGVLNCVYDQNIDRKMERTANRAIPSGKVLPRQALTFGFVITVTGIVLSYFLFNFLTSIMMVTGAICYLLVYTVLLKRKTSWNVVIGGLAGCFAALSGWTAAVNALSLTPILIATLDFLWTPGHLWALAIKKNQEYKKASIPMLPVTVGIKKAAAVTFGFNFAAVMLSLLPAFFGIAGVLYFTVAIFAGVWFAVESRKLAFYPSETKGFQLFLFSMPYLACLMVGMMVDKAFFLKPF